MPNRNFLSLLRHIIDLDGFCANGSMRGTFLPFTLGANAPSY